MLAITRQKTILELIKERHSVNVTDLAENFCVTNETIRRDLKALEEDGELTRTHGGAYITEGVCNNIDVSMRAVIRKQEKERLAKKCVDLIATGDSIFLDSSTTEWFIARQVIDKHITVLTHSLKIADILSESKTVNLIVVGGNYVSKSMSFSGNLTEQSLKSYFVDKAFISCRTVSMTNGVTDSNEDSSVPRQIMLRRCKSAYLVVDHTKLDGISFLQICDVADLTAIICDEKLPQNWLSYLSSVGVEAI